MCRHMAYLSFPFFNHDRLEFSNEDDAANAFETFLLGTKGSLTPSAIAKIRDTVGIMGMAGT